MLTLALTIYEDGMHSCGYPKHVCMHPDNDGFFELPEVTTICYADRVHELEQRERQANKNYVPEAGEVLMVEYTRTEPLPPITRRPTT